MPPTCPCCEDYRHCSRTDEVIKFPEDGFIFDTLEFFTHNQIGLLQNFEELWDDLKTESDRLAKIITDAGNNCQVVVVDGNVGNGKSSLLHYIQSKKIGQMVCVKEPVETWRNIWLLTENGYKNSLELYYMARNGKADEKFVLFFQIVVTLTRLITMAKYLVSANKTQVVIFERHPLSDK
jgi:hypothetical protein